jgi:hypothetical protein
VCALCEGPKVGGKAYYCIDHDHTTGKVRGLLCLTCNSALERAESVKGWIDRVRSYLLLHGG